MQDYDILFGLIACQLRLLSRASLSRLVASHEADSTFSDAALTSKSLSAHDHALLIRLVENVIHAHHGDVKAALESFGGDEAIQDAFANSVTHEKDSWLPNDDKTIVAEHLPHGLPVEIAPEPIGRYTGGSEYARGGIGRILLVHDEQLGRDVILKELLPHLNVSPTASTLSHLPPPDSPGTPIRQSATMMARFLQEAKITGQLEHPSIVPVYELGLRADGQLYYTMKLVRGDTLAVAIKNCTSKDDRLRLLRPLLDVCQAMAYAHSKGVIHRDLKPSNIMVGEFGECVVLDWGLAKTETDSDTDAHQEALEKTISQLKLSPEKLVGLKTGSREILGTPLYMAPEQARGDGESIGCHSDVYSIGVVLFEILTGDLPHKWTDSRDTILRVGTQAAPSITRVAPDTPPELAAICDKALQFSSDARYPNAGELANDIRRFLEGAVVDAYSYRVSDILKRLYRQHRTLIGVASVATLIVLAVGVASYINIYQARQVAEHERGIAVEQRAEADTQRVLAEEQRSRAETAEEATAWEKYVSDIRLADTYIKTNRFQAAEDILFATDTRYRNIEWGYLVAQLYQDDATLTGHTSNVFWLETAPNGETLLSVSWDRSARLWSLASHETLHTWQFSGARVLFGTFDQAGERIAFCLDDGRVLIASPETGESLLELKGHTAAVNHCAFSTKDNSLWSGGNDRKVIHWDLATGEQRGGLPDHPAAVKKLTLIDGDRRVLTETSENQLHLYDTQASILIAEAEGHNHEYAVDGGVVAAVTGNTAVLYHGSDLSEILHIPHEDTLRRCRPYPSAKIVLTACEDGNARVFSYPDGTLQRVFRLGDPVSDFQLLPNEDRIAAVSTAGVGFTWTYPGGEVLNRFAGHRATVQRMALTSDATQIITGAMDSSIRLWSVEHSARHRIAGQANGRPTNFVVATASPAYALTTDQGEVLVWNGTDEHPIYHGFFQHLGGGTALGLSPDGKLLGLVVDEFLPLIISLPEGKVLARLEGHEGTINSLHFDADGTEVVTTSWDRSVRVWRVSDGVLRATLEGHSNVTSFATFSPDKQWIASTSQDNTARIWSRESGDLYLEIKHDSNVRHGNFTKDSEYFVSVSTDGSAQIWHVESKALQTGFTLPQPEFSFVECEKSGERIVISESGGPLHIVDFSSGINLLSMVIENEGIRYFALNTEQDSAYLVNDHGTLYDVPIVPQDVLNPKGAVEHLRLERKDRSYNDFTGSSVSPVNHFIAQSTMISLLRDLANFSRDTQSSIRITESLLTKRSRWLFGLNVDDEVLLIDGIPPTTQLTEVLNKLSGTLPGNGVVITLDILRSEKPLRLRHTVLPVQSTSRQISLSKVQVEALLKHALRILTAGESQVLLVNRRVASRLQIPLERPDSLPGLYVSYGSDAIGSAMLRTGGLMSGGIVATIQGKPVNALSEIKELLRRALSNVENNLSYRATVELDGGSFRKIEVTYLSKGASN